MWRRLPRRARALHPLPAINRALKTLFYSQAHATPEKVDPVRQGEITPAYVREAAHLRAVAENVTNGPLRARLLEEAERQERLSEQLKKDEA